MSEDDRETILARRRLFVVSALASLAVTQTSCDKVTQPCLSIERVPDAAAPMSCLKPIAPPPTASSSAGADAGRAIEPRPTACLEVPAPAK